MPSDGQRAEYQVDIDANLLLPVSVKAQGTTWFLIE